jgi:hypothetical protein
MQLNAYPLSAKVLATMQEARHRRGSAASYHDTGIPIGNTALPEYEHINTQSLTHGIERCPS